MVALRKQHKLFVAAYNKPRHSTRSAGAEAPAGVLLCSGRTNPLPDFSHGPPATSSPGVMLGEDTGRTV